MKHRPTNTYLAALILAPLLLLWLSPAEAAETLPLAFEGWGVHVRRELSDGEVGTTDRALELLKAQLREIVRVVPSPALAELRKVRLWLSPEYPNTPPTAEYHPGADWLREKGRDPAMEKGVEFTNLRIFEAETRRMPNFTLHELAHAYHHRVLAGGFDNPRIKSAYEKAKAGGKYDRVERRDAEGRKSLDRAYALTNPQEYFAETTEAFFSTNDFFPFTRDELRQLDPEMFELLAELWGAGEQRSPPGRKTAAALPQVPVDFNHPARDYVTNEVHGWGVLLEKQLAEEAPELAATTLDRLENKLGEIATLLPTNALPDLRRLKVFLMHGPQAKAGGRGSGLEYFRLDAPRHHDWLDARMASSIVIFNAANYAKLTEHWALKSLMHEFGHGYHLEHWPEHRADIYDAWSAAMKSGLYQVVREEDKGTHNPNYAAQNHLEYFAELTTTYFVGNSYHPRDRATLKAYDPAGFALIEKLWGVCAPPPLSPRAGDDK